MAYGRKRRIYRRRTGGTRSVRRYPTRYRRSAYSRRKARRNKLDKRSYLRIRQPITTDNVYVKLRYHGQYRLTTSTIPTFGKYTLTGNGLYDPDITQVGRQCTGYDQWCQFYNKYIVYGSKITVTALNQATNYDYTVYLIPTLEQTPNWYGLSTYEVGELPYNKYSAMFGTAENKNWKKMKHYMSTKKIAGIKNIDEADFGTLTSSNPVNTCWYWQLYVVPFNWYSGPNTLDMLFDVKITYYARFYDRVTLPTS